MTFSELQTEILDRLNLSSTAAQTRIGRAINRKYRLITSSIGLQLSRRTTAQQTVTMGVSTVTFTNTEKIINVVNRAVTPYKVLDEVTLDELEAEMPFAANDGPLKYAIHSHTADTVTILINRIPQTAFTLYADVHQAVAALSGSNEPAFPESFHDIIIEGVLSDELRKMEKPALAQIAQKEYERILSDLRMWIAKSGYLDQYQGKTADNVRSGGAGGGAGAAFNGALSWTQTGLVTFDRDPSAPFAVTASSAKVDNLDADKLDGYDESAFAKLADNETVAGNWTFDGALILPDATSPAQTAEGSVVWDSDDDVLTVGTGAARKTMVDLDSAQTITGLKTFDRDPSAPFAVSASSAKVTNLDADLLDGEEGTAYKTNAKFTFANITATGTQNNYDPGFTAGQPLMVVLSNGSALTITGVNGAETGGQLLVFVGGNNSSGTTFSHNSGSSSAANRFFNVAEVDMVVNENGWIIYQYDSNVSFWRMVSHEQGTWITYTPTVGSGSGTITTASATGRYRVSGRTVHIQMAVTVTTNGTGATYLSATLPITAGSPAHSINGIEVSSTAYACPGYIAPSATTVVIRRYDGVYPAANGYVFAMSGQYEI